MLFQEGTVADVKTKPRTASVAAFLKRVDASRREDCEKLVAMMKQAASAEPVLRGPGIIGFGDRHYVYESGREGDTFQIGFAPRESDLILYLMGGLDQHEASLAKLGKYKRGKGCLYIKRLADIDPAVLSAILKAAVTTLMAKPKA
jgi:hypothetical protein